ncbi:Proteasome activator complex subunit 3 [Operophtera brumata]|uniref:Proteasome activator complex subunit 3 n=1 Tax=Operophtera brumata TaxID=104452 RepID=A0A0L7L414_OPEBR|nr:Proteasome activator complex subunit 3 [Operophtera brumata]
MANSLRAYKDSLKSNAKLLLSEGFPEKIQVLNQLLDSHFQINKLAAIHQYHNIQLSGDEEPSRKRRPIEPSGGMSGNIHVDNSEGPTSFLPCNKKLDDLIHLVKPHIQQWIEDFNLLRMWINLLLPTLEDEAGLHLTIQKRALDKINRPDKETAEILTNTSDYFRIRADILIDYNHRIHTTTYNYLFCATT